MPTSPSDLQTRSMRSPLSQLLALLARSTDDRYEWLLKAVSEASQSSLSNTRLVDYAVKLGVSDASRVNDLLAVLDSLYRDGLAEGIALSDPRQIRKWLLPQTEMSEILGQDEKSLQLVMQRLARLLVAEAGFERARDYHHALQSGITRPPATTSAVHADQTEPDQAEKQLQRFCPSSELAAFVLRGSESLREIRDDVTTIDPELLAEESDQGVLSEEEVREYITTMLERMFATLGFRAAYAGNEDLEAGREGRFTMMFQYEILDDVLVRPDEYGAFLSCLYDELCQYISEGGRMGGDWGELAISGDRLILKLSEPEQPGPEGDGPPMKIERI